MKLIKIKLVLVCLYLVSCNSTPNNQSDSSEIKKSRTVSSLQARKQYTSEYFQDLTATQEQKEKVFLQVFFSYAKDVKICPGNQFIEKVIQVKKSRNIDNNNSALGIKHEIKIPGKDCDPSEVAPECGAKFELLFIDGENYKDASVFLGSQYLFDTEGIDCISCNNGGLAPVILRDKQRRNRIFYLKSFSDASLTFVSRDDSLRIMPYNFECSVNYE